jgi:hypothetical protein
MGLIKKIRSAWHKAVEKVRTERAVNAPTSRGLGDSPVNGQSCGSSVSNSVRLHAEATRCNVQCPKCAGACQVSGDFYQCQRCSWHKRITPLVVPLAGYPRLPRR